MENAKIFGDRYRNVVGIFMNQLLQGEPMSIFGDGTQMRAFTHIDDVAPIIAGSVDCAAARNQIFNVGADMPYTVNDLSTIVAEGLHVPCKVVHLDPRNEVKIAPFRTIPKLNVLLENVKRKICETVSALWPNGSATTAPERAAFLRQSR